VLFVAAKVSECNSYCLYWFIHLAFVFMN